MPYRVASVEGVMHGLYLLWWVQHKQLSPAIVGSALAAGDLALMCLELPTGWFADRFGHRSSLLVGSTVQVVGMAWAWLGDGIPGLLISSVLIALGDAFRSGADQALAYRTCVALGEEDTFQAIEARAKTAELGALVVLTLVGGLVAERWSLAAGWIAETASCAVGIGIAWFMVEPPRGADDDVVRGGGEAHVAPILSRTMVLIVVPAAFVGGLSGAASFLAQTTSAGGPMVISTLVAMITAVEAMGSAAAVRVASGGARAQLLLAAIASAIALVGVAVPVTTPAVVLALSFLVGLAHPLRAAAIQRVASDNVRARAASLASACDMAVSTIALPLAGLSVTRRRR